MTWSEYAVAANRQIAVARIARLLPLCAVLAGCASQSLRPGADDPAQVTHSINLSGFTSEYKSGFAAGCTNERNAPGRREKHSFKDASFAQGWHDGADYCRARKTR
jgi:hypothetical protein